MKPSGEVIFGNKATRETWSARQESNEGGTRQGARPRGGGRPHPREHLPWHLTWGPSPSGSFPSKNNFSS